MAKGAGVKRSPTRKGLGGRPLASGTSTHRARPRARARERLDTVLVARGLAESREKAARMILAGGVTVDGVRVDKAGALVDPASSVGVAARPKFVSRGGDKLAPVLDAFAVSPAGRICMDVGASTGGFTHCLLERGAT